MDEGTGVDSREFKLMQLGVLGFDTCPYVYMEAGKHSKKELKEQIEKLKTIASEKEIPIDGLVLIYDNLSYLLNVEKLDTIIRMDLPTSLRMKLMKQHYKK